MTRAVLLLPLLVLTGCPQECELVALAVSYMHGLVFGSMGVVGLALVIALIQRGTRSFLATLLTVFALGALGLALGFLIARAIPCEYVWLHRIVPWGCGLIAMPLFTKFVRRLPRGLEP